MLLPFVVFLPAVTRRARIVGDMSTTFKAASIVSASANGPAVAFGEDEEFVEAEQEEAEESVAENQEVLRP